jgi:PKHD-type hydroxylase
MRGEWCYFKSYVSKENCERIINDCMSVPSQDGVLGLEQGINDQSIRKSKVRFLYSTEERFNYIFDILWKTAIMANKDFFDIQISKLDFIQFTEYNELYKGEYKEHHDVFWMNGDPYYHRKLSCVVQLSNPNSYQGGDFEITEASQPLDKESKLQGSIIYFPSLIKHKVTPVTKGTRYSLVAWFEGPKWR